MRDPLLFALDLMVADALGEYDHYTQTDSGLFVPRTMRPSATAKLQTLLERLKDKMERPPQEEIDAHARTLSRDIADYLHDTNTKNLILLDTSARPAARGIRKAWKQEYDAPMPNTYFINPFGFSYTGSPTRLDRYRENPLIRELLPPEKARELAADAPQQRPLPEIIADLTKQHPYLMRDKHRSTMVLDTCAHTNVMMDNVTHVLREAGFTRLTTALMTVPLGITEIKDPDLIFCDDAPWPCEPYGKAPYVTKQQCSVLSARS